MLFPQEWVALMPSSMYVVGRQRRGRKNRWASLFGACVRVCAVHGVELVVSGAFGYTYIYIGLGREEGY